MLVAGVVGASLGFVEGIALKGLVWLEHGSYENDMLFRYKKYQAEKLILDGQMKQKSQIVRDKWRETELLNIENNQSGQSGNTLGSITRAIVQFFREKYDKPNDT
jgi:hypothetical protein